MRLLATCVGAVATLSFLQPAFAEGPEQKDKAAIQEMAEIKEQMARLAAKIEELEQKLETPPTAEQPAVYPRTYRVSDLVRIKNEAVAARQFDSLMSYIQRKVAPDQWEAAGGAGTMAPYPQNLSLVISQTAEVHEEIRELLDRVRDAKKVMDDVY